MTISIGRPDFIPVTMNSRALSVSKGLANSVSLGMIIGVIVEVGAGTGV